MSESLTTINMKAGDEEIIKTVTLMSLKLSFEVHTDENYDEIDITILYKNWGEGGNEVTHFLIDEDETAQFPNTKPLESFNELLYDVLEDMLSNKDERKEAAEKIYKIVEDKVNEIQELG